MLLQQNPEITCKDSAGVECIHFVFRGHFSEADAMVAVERWRALLVARPGKRLPHVWVCEEMTGYDGRARHLWTESMREFVHQIDDVWLVSTSPLIRLGAKLVTKFLPITLRPVWSEREIQPPQQL